MLVGLAIGLLVGLAIAVVVTLYMSRSPVPFVDKIKRPADRPEAATPADVPDPNRSMQKSRPASTEPPVAVTPPAAPGTDARSCHLAPLSQQRLQRQQRRRQPMRRQRRRPRPARPLPTKPPICSRLAHSRVRKMPKP